MSADERIKIIFESVYVYRDADSVGSGDWYFIANVDGLSVGDRNREFNAEENRPIPLPQPQWSKEINVAGRDLNNDPVIVRFQVKDSDLTSDEDLGSIELRLRRDVRQGSDSIEDYRRRNPYFRLNYKIELSVLGRFGPHPPDAVFATRHHQGSVSCTTVSGGSFTARMEICPVFPIPDDAGFVPISFPRPPNAPPQRNVTYVPEDLNPNSPINYIPNPPAIPILSPADANANTAARIEFTYYHPRTLRFTDVDPRLEWSIVPIPPSVPAGGQTRGGARFLGPNRGTKVLVYGTAEGEVRLEMRFQGALFATYRALVLPIRQIQYRANILNGPAGSQPRSGPEHVRDHIAIANRFLHQMAIELVPDPDNTVTDRAITTGIQGIFRIRVAAGVTRNIPVTDWPRATRLNYRQGVFNIAYIHSSQRTRRGGPRALGLADSWLANGAGNTIIDNGTPSTSWIIPTGIPPDGAAGNVTMALLDARERDPARFPRLFAMSVTNLNGDPALPADQLTYGGTIAHELGHVLNFPHRGVEDGEDGLNHPFNENVMHRDNPSDEAQDFDIIQTRAAHQSLLVRP